VRGGGKRESAGRRPGRFHRRNAPGNICGGSGRQKARRTHITNLKFGLDRKKKKAEKENRDGKSEQRKKRSGNDIPKDKQQQYLSF
jgi:hypothetical protein